MLTEEEAAKLRADFIEAMRQNRRPIVLNDPVKDKRGPSPDYVVYDEITRFNELRKDKPQ